LSKLPLEGTWAKVSGIAGVAGIVVAVLLTAGQNRWWPFDTLDTGATTSGDPGSTSLTQPSLSPTPQFIQGAETLVNSQGIDLDSGRIAYDEKSSYIDVSPGPSGDHMYGIGPGVSLALLPTISADKSICEQAISSNTASNKRAVALYDLRPHQIICVKTNQQRISILILDKIPSSAPLDDAVTFHYTTYP